MCHITMIDVNDFHFCYSLVFTTHHYIGGKCDAQAVWKRASLEQIGCSCISPGTWAMIPISEALSTSKHLYLCSDGDSPWRPKARTKNDVVPSDGRAVEPCAFCM